MLEHTPTIKLSNCLVHLLPCPKAVFTSFV
nr:MAG TPA: hypothetical protein [Caudoviricetes sp.]